MDNARGRRPRSGSARRLHSLRGTTMKTRPHSTPRMHNAAPTRALLPADPPTTAACSVATLTGSSRLSGSTGGSRRAVTVRGTDAEPSDSEWPAPATLSRSSSAMPTVVMSLIISNCSLSMADRWAEHDGIVHSLPCGLILPLRGRAPLPAGERSIERSSRPRNEDEPRCVVQFEFTEVSRVSRQCPAGACRCREPPPAPPLDRAGRQAPHRLHTDQQGGSLLDSRELGAV